MGLLIGSNIGLGLGRDGVWDGGGGKEVVVVDDVVVMVVEMWCCFQFPGESNSILTSA